MWNILNEKPYFYIIVNNSNFLNWQHEDYNFPDADVALLYVDGEVDSDGTTVDFVTLAETDAEDFVGNECEIAGRGQTDGEWEQNITEQDVKWHVSWFASFQ